eukprot:4103271-Pleurochrysis_carterae.AAC.1
MAHFRAKSTGLVMCLTTNARKNTIRMPRRMEKQFDPKRTQARCPERNLESDFNPKSNLIRSRPESNRRSDGCSNSEDRNASGPKMSPSCSLGACSTA